MSRTLFARDAVQDLFETRPGESSFAIDVNSRVAREVVGRRHLQAELGLSAARKAGDLGYLATSYAAVQRSVDAGNPGRNRLQSSAVLEQFRCGLEGEHREGTPPCHHHVGFWRTMFDKCLASPKKKRK